MMSEYAYYFATTLQRKLKSRIKGKIYITVTEDDALFVKIMNGTNGDVKLYFEKFSEKVKSNWSTDDAVVVVIDEYKRVLNERYFY